MDASMSHRGRTWMHPICAPFLDHAGAGRSGCVFESATQGVKMGQVDSFRRIADVMRAAQRAAIEAENAPDKRKRLRTFSVQEAATLLGVTQRELRALQGRVGRRWPLGGRIPFEELQSLRPTLGSSISGEGTRVGNQRVAGEKLATVVFANFKGGSAKTTSSVHFAQYMALQGYRVLLIDLDSQASATAQFGIDPSTDVGRDNSFTAWTTAREAGTAIAAQSLCQPTYW